MIEALLALAAGYLSFIVLVLVFERKTEIRRFWIARTSTALIVGLVLWKLTPLWTRWDAVFDNPWLLFYMNGGLAALLGGVSAFLAVVGLSLWQFRKVKPDTRRWPLWVSVAAGLGIMAVATLVEPMALPLRPTDSAAGQLLVPDLEGRLHALADWKGRVVVVNFWTTGSLPSLAELPELQLFSKAPANRAVLVGVDLIGTEKESLAGVLRFTSKQKLNWTQLTDPAGRSSKGVFRRHGPHHRSA